MVQKVRADDRHRRPETFMRRVVRTGPSDERKGVETLSEYVSFRASMDLCVNHRLDCTTPILKETGCNHMSVCARPLSLSLALDVAAHLTWIFLAVHLPRVQHPLLLRLW